MKSIQYDQTIHSTNSTPTKTLTRPRSLSLNYLSSTTDSLINNTNVFKEKRDNLIFIPDNRDDSLKFNCNIGQENRRAPLLTMVCECGKIENGTVEISIPNENNQLMKNSTNEIISSPKENYFRKQPLNKSLSTCSATTKLPTSQSPRARNSNSSPTGKSRPFLPSSPSGAQGQHKRHQLDDHNPFGADLVRYQRNGSIIARSTNRMSFSTTGGGKHNSEAESTAIGATRDEKDDTGILKANGRMNKSVDIKVETPGDMENSGTESCNGGHTVGASSTGGFLRNRFSTRRIRTRLMQKDGECNISLYNVPKQKTKYFADIFTTLVEVKWRWCLLIFALGFLLSWLLFAMIYYLIMLSHGDFDETRKKDAKWKYCVHEIRNFVSVFMFSLESQHTIGYGSRYPSEECPAVVATVCLQSMVGVMIQTFMAGIVFAKLARAKKRAETLIFSKNAVVCMRDGRLCLLFRVGDMRKSQLAEAHVRLQMISKRITNEGELLPFHQFDMNVGYDCGLDRIFVVWPITICHVIDENSPLYEYSADDLATARFEIIAILEGVVPSTGTTTQARTSYLPQEIIWGSRFEKLVTYQRENGEYRIDFSKFHKTYVQETPTCSARDLDLLKEVGWNLDEVYHVQGDDEAENDGLTPYSTVQSLAEFGRPTILPAERMSTELTDQSINHICFTSIDDDDSETVRLLPSPPTTAALITMTPAERKASIAAAAAAFRKNKSLSESIRKASLGVHHTRFRKPSMNMVKLAADQSLTGTPTQRRRENFQRFHNGGNGDPYDRFLRHAASTGSVAVLPHMNATKARPSSILREHDIM